ncbi:MAG: hypothetical protein U9N54_07770, partial [candidate division Zixibacteria bacterium]|nr:hypothetical protein [candidate division Zixibacteria bacterium]
MKRKGKTLRNILRTGAAIVGTTVLSAFSFNAEAQNQYYSSQPNDSIVSFGSQEQENDFWENINSALNSNQPKSTTNLPTDPTHPMFGLNQWVPAFSPDFTYDFYGSGDWDNDGDIDTADYNAMTVGTNNYRGDTNLDGVPGTVEDQQIVWEYLQGQRTHINIWELETPTERINHFTNIANNVDSIEYIPNSTSGWICGDYTYQTFINYNGVYDIQNCNLNSPPNLSLDFSKNGRYRIPVRYVSTKTSTNVPHAIVGVALGHQNTSSSSPTEFDQNVYFEPQLGTIVVPGDFSLND